MNGVCVCITPEGQAYSSMGTSGPFFGSFRSELNSNGPMANETIATGTSMANSVTASFFDDGSGASLTRVPLATTFRFL